MPASRTDDLRPERMYAKNGRPDHMDSNRRFCDLMLREYPNLRLFQPAPSTAPWLWQAVLRDSGSYVVVDFWPHVLKAAYGGYKARDGEAGIRHVIDCAVLDATALHA